MLAQFTQPPIVIGGCGRSGTTLLLSMLSAHPHIYAIAEEAWAFWPTETMEEFQKLIDKFQDELETFDIPSTCTRWCEKTPKNVAVFGQLIEGLGDELRIIHIVRDGRDVVTSVHPHAPERYWVPWWRWVEDVRAGLAFYDHPQVLTIRYEDIVLDFENSIRNVCEFINEECGERMLSWYEHATVRHNAAWTGEVSPVFSSSVGKWKHSSHAKTVSEFLAQEEAVELMKRLGYLN